MSTDLRRRGGKCCQTGSVDRDILSVWQGLASINGEHRFFDVG